MLGTNPQIDPNSTQSTNLPMQYDFRSVYASVLKDWFCLDTVDVDTVLLNTFQPLTLVDPTGCLSSSVHELNQAAGASPLTCTRNPFVERTTLRFLRWGEC